MIVHLIDGTYELFRHFYASRPFNKGVDRPYGAPKSDHVGSDVQRLKLVRAGLALHPKPAIGTNSSKRDYRLRW